MLLQKENYESHIAQVLGEDGDVKIAVAFLGAGVVAFLKKSKARSIKLICNFALGGTNPTVVKQLMAEGSNVEVRQLDNLHAKLILGEKSMVLGSANLSSNGLGMEGDEAAYFEELGVHISDADMLRKADAWFEVQWGASREITQEDIDSARKKWEGRRARRPSATARSFLGLTEAQLAEKDFRLLIYTDPDIDQTAGKAEEIKSRADFERPENCAGLDFYEDWGVDEIPPSLDAVIIPVYYKASGKVEVQGIQQPYLLERVACSGGKVVNLHVTRVVKDVTLLSLPFKFDLEDRKALATVLEEWLDDQGATPKGKKYWKSISASDLLAWHSTRPK